MNHAPPSSLVPLPAGLDDVIRRYPAWDCCQGNDRLYYAQLRDSDPPVRVRGEDPVDLRDQIQAAIYRREARSWA